MVSAHSEDLVERDGVEALLPCPVVGGLDVE